MTDTRQALSDTALTWTAQTPMVEGVYWWRYTEVSEPDIVVVFTSHTDGKLYSGTWGTWRHCHCLVGQCKGEWAGPIQKPRGDDGATAREHGKTPHL